MKVQRLFEDKRPLISKVSTLKKEIRSKYHPELLDIMVTDSGNIGVTLLKRKKGTNTGPFIMSAICKFADENKLSIFLTPTEDMGSNQDDLIKFYAFYGFEFIDSENMERKPK